MFLGSPLAGQMFFRATLFVSYFEVLVLHCIMSMLF